MKITNTKSIGAAPIKIVVYGEPGVGKTSLAKTIKEPTLIISAESGLLSIAGSDIDFIDISQDDNGNMIPKEQRIKRLGEAYQYLLSDEARKKYKWIVIDSLTEISQNLIEQLNQEFPERKDSLVMYGENSKRMRSLVKSFRDLPYYNVVMIALPSVEKDESGMRFLTVDLVGSFSSKLPALFDEVFYMHVNKEGERFLLTEKSDKVVCKDRSGKLHRLEKPDLKHIADKINGKKEEKK